MNTGLTTSGWTILASAVQIRAVVMAATLPAKFAGNTTGSPTRIADNVFNLAKQTVASRIRTTGFATVARLTTCWLTRCRFTIAKTTARVMVKTTSRSY